MGPDEDDIMRRDITEAGDPTVEPGADHVARVRSTLLDHLGPPRKRRAFSRRLVAASVAAAFVGFLAWSMLSRPAIAWAQVGQALKDRTWIHTRIVGPDGAPRDEAWFSPRSGIVAFRHGDDAEYRDEKLGIVHRFVPAEGVVYRLPSDDGNSWIALDLDFYQDLIAGRGPARSPLRGVEVVGEERRNVIEGTRALQEVELTLAVIAGDARRKFRVRVDPQTKLLDSWAFLSDAGVWATTTFDYPAQGPADLFDLGVPRTAKLVDRMPGEDLNRLLAGLKAGRNRFDDYTGFVVGQGPVPDVARVSRKGHKWRAESILPHRKTKPIPEGADLAWWKVHQADYTFTTSAICDGKMTWYYRLNDARLDPDAVGPPAVSLLMRMEVSDPDDNPMMPWPHLMAEQLGHPDPWHPSHDRAFLVEPKPEDAPPETVRVRVFNPQVPEAGRADLYRLWIKPDQNFLAIRAETSVFQGGNPGKLEYVETKIIEDVTRSPGGFWYPTRVRRKTSQFPTEEVSRFLLDFEAIPLDDLFVPLNLPPKP